MLSKTPLNLAWCDLEFTTTDLSRAKLMQVALLITTPDLIPIPAPDGSLGLSFDLRLDTEAAATASDWVKGNQGELLQRCQQPGLPSAADVDGLLASYVADACAIGGQPPYRERVLLAGNSVHIDYRLLTEAMPKVGAMLSFRLIDVTTLKELAVRWRPELRLDKSNAAAVRAELEPLGLTAEGKAHDALFDIKTSIAELSFYRRRLIQPAVIPTPAVPAGPADRNL